MYLRGTKLLRGRVNGSGTAHQARAPRRGEGEFTNQAKISQEILRADNGGQNGREAIFQAIKTWNGSELTARGLFILGRP